MLEIQKYINSISSFSEENWTCFKSLFIENKFEKGDYFVKEGEVAKKIGLLTDGIIRAFYRNYEGNEYNKTFFTPISFIGAYSSLITNQTNLINIQCLTDCTLFVSDYKNLTNLYDTHPEFERLARRLAEVYFVNKEKREIEMVMLDAEQRYDIFQQEHPTLEQLIPQYHIASYLGVTPTQLSRIRAKKSKT